MSSSIRNHGSHGAVAEIPLKTRVKTAKAKPFAASGSRSVPAQPAAANARKLAELEATVEAIG